MREPSESTSSAAAGAADLLGILLDGKARTKSELSVLTGVSRVTIASRVDMLLRADLLRHVGTDASSGGRPPAQVAFHADAGLIVAADLGATRATVALTNLSAQVVALRTWPLDIALGPEAVLDEVAGVAEELLADHGSVRLVGVGIGLPGGIEHSTGRPISPPIMPGWDRFEVPAYLQQTFPVPVVVENDVNILALGEHELSWPNVEDLIFLKVATGLGAGIISGGALQRGSQGIAGDIGHIWVPGPPGTDGRAGEEQPLGNTASGRGIVAELQSRGSSAQSADDVVALLSSGDPIATEVVRDAGRAIGQVLAMLVNTLNPHVVVIGGWMARSGEHLMAGIRETVYRRSIPLATQDLQIVLARGGEQTGVVGAATLVMRDALAASALTTHIENANRTA
jgi:predicted NBD/HSP70 family sugar kinase